MLLQIPDLLTADQIAHARRQLDMAGWVPAQPVLPDEDPVAQALGDLMLESLQRHAHFVAAALPLRVFPPIFSRDTVGVGDADASARRPADAIRQFPGAPLSMRIDLSATVCFDDPVDYDGGELIVEDAYGAQTIKLSAGHLVLASSTSKHHLRRVARGTRRSASFCVQSLVRHDADRALLFELDGAIQRLTADLPDHPELVRLTGVYHNLLRGWAEL